MLAHIIGKNISLFKELNDEREPTNKEIKEQEHFVSLKEWNSFKCVGCKNVSDMFKCKSLDGFLICPKCGKLN